MLELELRMTEQRLHVLDPAGQQVVDRDHLAAFVEQAAAEVRTDEAGPPGDQDPLQGSNRAHATFPSGASGESDERKKALSASRQLRGRTPSASAFEQSSTE
jgi:hypothetical protein